ncbi:hypothetical protein [Pelagerythrobacter aerophilus]|uniref:META domain-containing protein n=1 Tax=Pelagerythrobacter aerophilus TaxID=2306995 RepID=A0A418NKR9_9SPHN|nr:hypothetical protein [Pelagerythrobacter aerophilus]RIV80291.1 hypothetical protein D2V04_03065 [Pelagerythrobacter aerophilus]
MRRYPLLLASAAFLAACQQTEDSAAPPPQATSSPTETVEQTPSREAPASLIGEYRVAGIDGTEVGGQIGIALSVTETNIFYDPRCAGFDWTYTYEGGALTTERPADRAVCEIAVHPEQQRLAAALDAVTQAERTPSNGIELSGGGHSVTLFSQ